MRTKIVILQTLLLVGLLVGPARAQLSPGPLSAPHAHLEGLRHCVDCHKLGDRNVVPKCLECHRIVAARREAGRGLHAGEEFGICTDCHVEHRGREADLIFWPDGIEGFDHAQAGLALEGRHRHIQCRDCHRADHIADPEALHAADKDLDRTYLGLDSACAACHVDVHRAQMPGACSSCHGQETWAPAPGFSHDAAAFPLTGRHRDVACSKCHAPLDPEAPVAGAARYVGLAHTLCTDCHRDPHDDRLGPRCADCHTTDGWRTGRAADFDHERTRYPLRGRHAQVRCERCHVPERALPAFAACTDCHRDVHDGRRAQRPRLLDCEGCHDVGGFRPARYTFEQHRTGTFPLSGAHRATPCDACHRPTGAAGQPFDLVLDHGACTDCHRDPHGPVSRAEVRTCTLCHDDASWRRVRYDHAATGFPLTDGHARPACAECHRPADATTDQPVVPVFTETDTACASCHVDIHGGQFVVDGAVRCERCHDTVDWFAAGFDHDRDSRFPLRGGHEGVACERCHAPLAQPGTRSLHFKPLETECMACHQVAPAPPGGDR